MKPITSYFLKLNGRDTAHPTVNVNKETTSAAVYEVSHPSDCARVEVESSRITQFYSSDDKALYTSYAMQHGISATLCRYPTLKRTTLRHWVARAKLGRKTSLEACPEGSSAININLDTVLGDQRVHNGRRLPETVFDEVYDWFHSTRARGHAVSRLLLKAKVLQLVQAGCPQLLKENGGWLVCSDDLLRTLEGDLNVTRRRATTAKRGLVHDDERMRDLFLSRVAFVCDEHAIPPQLVFHMDETGTALLPISKKNTRNQGFKASGDS